MRTILCECVCVVYRSHNNFHSQQISSPHIHDLRLICTISVLQQLQQQQEKRQHRRKLASIFHFHFHLHRSTERRAQNGFNDTYTQTHRRTLLAIALTQMQTHSAAALRKMTNQSRHHPLQRRRWKQTHE